jgi:hypothetical protein
VEFWSRIMRVTEAEMETKVVTPDSDDGLTPETLAYIRWQEENPDVWGTQDEFGNDLAQIRENLKLTPAERLRRHGIALAQMMEVEEAGARLRSADKNGSGIS